eukprot:tig00000405_g486.t1
MQVHIAPRAGAPRFRFMPLSLYEQIVARIVTKVHVRMRRFLYPSHPEPAPRPLPFASGSASFPLRRGAPPAPRPLGLALQADVPYPFVLQACRSVLQGQRAPPPSPPSPPPPLEVHLPINELFRDVLGLEAGRTPGPSAAEGAPDSELMPIAWGSRVLAFGDQRVRGPREGALQPALLSRVGEAMRASLDLSLQLESMSLSGSGSPRPAASPPLRPLRPPPANPRRRPAPPEGDDSGPGAPAPLAALLLPGEPTLEVALPGPSSPPPAAAGGYLNLPRQFFAGSPGGSPRLASPGAASPSSNPGGSPPQGPPG